LFGGDRGGVRVENFKKKGSVRIGTGRISNVEPLGARPDARGAGLGGGRAERAASGARAESEGASKGGLPLEGRGPGAGPRVVECVPCGKGPIPPVPRRRLWARPSRRRAPSAPRRHRRVARTRASRARPRGATPSVPRVFLRRLCARRCGRGGTALEQSKRTTMIRSAQSIENTVSKRGKMRLPSGTSKQW
jgi:hypothetical protein